MMPYYGNIQGLKACKNECEGVFRCGAIHLGTSDTSALEYVKNLKFKNQAVIYNWLFSKEIE